MEKENLKKRILDFKVKTNNNSSMAQDLEEMERLGKEMDQAQTETQLEKEEDLTQDPKQ